MYFLVAGALRFAPASALHGTPFVLVIARPWLMDDALCWSVPTRLTPICIRALRGQPELPLRAAPREDVRCTVRCTALLPCSSLREHWNARQGGPRIEEVKCCSTAGRSCSRFLQTCSRLAGCCSRSGGRLRGYIGIASRTGGNGNLSPPPLRILP